jgi:hypothetical protein
MNRKKYFELFQRLLEQKKDYPIGIVAHFGPDDKTATKIVAGIIQSRDANPIIKSWLGPNIAEDQEIVDEIGQFFIGLGAKEVIVTDGIVGCPHDEGQNCQYCPFWSSNNSIEEKNSLIQKSGYKGK